MKTDQVVRYIVKWLSDYRERSGLTGFVVGVSGGVDSAVTSTLCAMTKNPVFALCMPIEQKPDQVDLAKKHSKWLVRHFPNVKDITIELSSIFSSIKDTFPANIQDGLTMANTRSRLRMMALYTFAGHHRMLVAGTGNKIEDFGIGFFTKYGDGGVDLSPIADLLKSEVYAIGKHMGLDPGILAAAPTDGLWTDGRTDESQIGATYNELEWAMAFDFESRDEKMLTSRQREVLEIYRKFNRSNQHKMLPIPVCKIPEDFR